MTLEPTPYYPEFLKYFELAKRQQELCNVSESPPYGLLRHDEYTARSIVRDDLMSAVTLYDVVERKYAGTLILPRSIGTPPRVMPFGFANKFS